jgi:hypothetical protein
MKHICGGLCICSIHFKYPRIFFAWKRLFKQHLNVPAKAGMQRSSSGPVVQKSNTAVENQFHHPDQDHRIDWIRSSLENAQKKCDEAERHLNSSASHDLDCLSVWLDVNAEGFPSANLTVQKESEIPAVVNKDPAAKSVADAILKCIATDSGAKGSGYIAKKFEGSCNVGGKVMEYSSCGVTLLPKESACFSMVHVNPKGDKDVGVIYLHVGVKGKTTNMCPMEKCPLAIIISGATGAVHEVFYNDKNGMFHFYKNPLFIATNAYKAYYYAAGKNSSGIREVVQGFAQVDSSKTNSIHLYRIEQSNGTVDFMLCRRPKLEKYIKPDLHHQAKQTLPVAVKRGESIEECFKSPSERYLMAVASNSAKACSKSAKSMLRTMGSYKHFVKVVSNHSLDLLRCYAAACKKGNTLSRLPIQKESMRVVNGKDKPSREQINDNKYRHWTFTATIHSKGDKHSIFTTHALKSFDVGYILSHYYKYTLDHHVHDKKHKQQHLGDIAAALAAVRKTRSTSSSELDGGFKVYDGDKIAGCTVTVKKTNVYELVKHQFDSANSHEVARKGNVVHHVAPICSDAVYVVEVRFAHDKSGGFTIKVSDRIPEKPLAIEQSVSSIKKHDNASPKHSSSSSSSKVSEFKMQQQIVKVKFPRHYHHHHKPGEQQGYDSRSIGMDHILSRAAELQLDALTKDSGKSVAVNAVPKKCGVQLVRVHNDGTNDHVWSIVKSTWSLSNGKNNLEDVSVYTKHSLTLSCGGNHPLVELHPEETPKAIDDHVARRLEEFEKHRHVSVGGHRALGGKANGPRALEQQRIMGAAPISSTPSKNVLSPEESLKALKEFEQRKSMPKLGQAFASSTSKFELGSILTAADRVFSSSL